MARMVVIYKTPDNPAAFDKHYYEVHVPLAKGLVGLEKYEISTGPVTLMGSATDTYLVAILYFPSLEAMKLAFATDLGRQCAADRRTLAPDDLVQIFLYDDKVV
jgi:uncharacterized protein (TIGR02118 family)